MSLRPIVNSPLGQFAFESIRPLLDNSPFGQFALLSIRPQTDNSPFSQSALSAIRLYIKQNKNSYWRIKINIKKWEENNAKINLLDISACDFVFLDKNKENTKTKCINVEQNELILHKIFFPDFLHIGTSPQPIYKFGLFTSGFAKQSLKWSHWTWEFTV